MRDSKYQVSFPAYVPQALDKNGAEHSVAQILPLVTCCCSTLISILVQAASCVSTPWLNQVQKAVQCCLDGPVGELLSALSDAAREGDGFSAICRSVVSLAATAVQASGHNAIVMKCVRRLVASLLPAGDEEEDSCEEGDEDDYEAEGDGEEGDPISSNEEEADSDPIPEGHQLSDEELEREEKEEEGYEQEEEEEGEEVALDDEAEMQINSALESDLDEGEQEDCGEMGEQEDEEMNVLEPECSPSAPLSNVKRSHSAMPPLDFTEELAQPALPLLPSVPNRFAAASASFLLQCLVQHPLFSEMRGEHLDGPVSFAAPLPDFVSRMATPIASVLDLVVVSPGALRKEESVFLSSAVVPPPSLHLELLLLLETLVDMRRAFHGTGGGEYASDDWPRGGDGSEDRSLLALLRLLQCLYGATLSPEDRACVRIMFNIDALLQTTPPGQCSEPHRFQ